MSRNTNTYCVVCDKPLYRRPCEFKKGVEFCCSGCRSELYKRREPSKNLKLGRIKGTNHLEGIKKSKSSNIKRSITHKQNHINNPEIAIKRGKKNRGENHYNWKGGVSNINIGIRLLWEYRKWQNKVKDRDGRICTKCKSSNNLEAHHKIKISVLIENNNIQNINDARECDDFWDINNGITLCYTCHKLEHKTD